MADALQIERIAESEIVLIKLAGVLNESFEPAKLEPLPSLVAVDLGQVARITPPGVRQWCDFVRRSGERRFFLINCPPVIVDQLNLMLNFAGAGKVLTARLKCVCEACHRELEVLVDLIGHGGAAPSRPACESCGKIMAWDDPNALRFVPRCGARQLPPRDAELLAKVGAYRASALGHRALGVRKLVEPEATVLRLDGEIDGRLQPERTADGVEGTALVVMGAVTLMATGVSPLRQFLELIERQCTAVILVDIPGQMVEMIEGDELQLRTTRVHSLKLPFYCTECDDLRHRTVVLAELAPVGGDHPAPPCQRCGRASELVKGMVSLRRLYEHTARVAPEVRALIDRVDQLFSSAGVEARIRESGENAAGGRAQIGGYRLLRPLSSGGMAEVFIAAKGSLGGVEKRVALKVFRRSMFHVSRSTVHMFLKEARLCARLNHPNIIEVYDVGEDAGDLYMAMEYIEGRDLLAILHRSRKVPAPVVVQIGILVASALDYAHHARDFNGELLGIVHRDVSLQNVLIGFDGRVKLIDFGVAITGEERALKPRLLAGNARYMSPEQVQREPLDGRSDVFSLGVVLYEALAGKRLFGRNKVDETLMAVLSMKVPPIPGVPAALNAVLLRALAKDPAKRYKSAAELEQALRGLAEELGGRLTQADLGAFVAPLFRSVDLPDEGDMSFVKLDPGESVATETARKRRFYFAGFTLAAVTVGATLAWILGR